MLKIAYLGPKGTFTEVATKCVFPKEELISFPSIPDCMDEVVNGSVDFAVVPLENAIEGSVNLTVDYLLHQQALFIHGEINVPIEQHLLVSGKNGSHLSEIEEVFSHPHAIAQCHQFLRTSLPEVKLQYFNSTGAAAEYVAIHSEKKIAAIGNELAASQYGLKIVRSNIHDYANNHTRFVVVKNNRVGRLESPAKFIGEKTTLMVTLPADYPGALHHVLSAFAWRKLNLSKIESRPMKTGLGNYFFVIDVDKQMDDVLIPGVIAELQALQCQVTVLGSYPCFSYNRRVKQL